MDIHLTALKSKISKFLLVVKAGLVLLVWSKNLKNIMKMMEWLEERQRKGS